MSERDCTTFYPSQSSLVSTNRAVLSVMKRTISDKGRKTVGWLATTLALSLGAACVPPDADANGTGDVEAEEHVSALSGVNLAGVNLAGVNLAGVNLAGVNLAGVNMGGTNLAGVNLAGVNLAGVNLAGVNLGGNNLAGVNLAGVNLAGVNLAGVNLAGVNLAGVNLAGTNLAGSSVPGTKLSGNGIVGSTLGATNLPGADSGYNIHLAASAKGMLYSGEDVVARKTDQCIVTGIGSTAFAKLLGQQSANARMNVALGKLPWGFSATSRGPLVLDAWEAIMWGDKTYCSFVMAAPPGTPWPGIAGFIKAVFRWNAPPTQSIDISGIERSAAYDSTMSTEISTYTGMMNGGARWRAGSITPSTLLAGEVAFITATTNNESVAVDFASWARDVNLVSMVLGNVQAVNPPTYAESVYVALDNGDGTVQIIIDDAARMTFLLGGMPAGMTNSTANLGAAYNAWKAGSGPKPIPLRCGGALYLKDRFNEPVPPGKCDSGLAWSTSVSINGAATWTSVAGTTSPMNRYMLLTPSGGTYQRAQAGALKKVLSETYIHMWEKSYTTRP
jgi:uncharacterized protein YjbI with pentapeptide repeats